MTRRQKITSTIGFLLTFLILFSFVRRELYLRTDHNKDIEVYDPDYACDYNVLLLGPSTMTMGISPMMLWKEYGITSYNLASHGNTIALNYWTLKNALDYTTPDLVILDVHFINQNIKLGELYSAHQSFDIVPLSATKFDGIQDIISDDLKPEFLFPFFAYHSRWPQLEDPSFWSSEYNTYTRGFDLDRSVQLTPYAVSSLDWDDTETIDPTETIGKEYICKIIELCQSKDIDILLMLVPYYFDQTDPIYTMYNSTQTIADQYGINYLNMNLLDSVIDYRTDMTYNKSHLNLLGARKTTHALGEYLLSNYSFDSDKQAEIQSLWVSDYSRYYNALGEKLKETKDLSTYLMILAAGDYRIDVTIYDSSILSSEIVSVLWETLCANTDQMTVNYMQHDTTKPRIDLEITVSSVLTGEEIDHMKYSGVNDLIHE